MAHKTVQALDASGAQLALIARVGQDLSKYKLRYSHIAFVWRDHPGGRWLLMHELNQCGTGESALYNEGMGNFFLDNVFAFETLIIIPGAASQGRIAALLASDMPLRLHAPRYNMLAYAYSTEYQNSNQWVLEMLAAADSNAVKDRRQAQAWLAQAGYRPITINIPALTRLGARVSRANVAFDDHPFERRMSGLIDTVTVESLVRFVERRDPAARKIVLSLSPQ